MHCTLRASISQTLEIDTKKNRGWSSRHQHEGTPGGRVIYSRKLSGSNNVKNKEMNIYSMVPVLPTKVSTNLISGKVNKMLGGS